METKNLEQAKPEDTVNNTAKVSNQQASAQEQKNNLQSNTAAEESKTVSKQEKGKNPGNPSLQTVLATPDILTDDTAQIFVWLENASQTPRQLKALLDTVDTKIELIEEILSKQSKQAQRVPGIDRRIETLDLYGEQVDTRDRYLSELNKIKLQTELTNLKEKRFQVWQKFVKACGSEKKALKYQNLRAKAKSSYYHNKSGYFVKQRILKILNTIIQKDKPALEVVKKLADNSSDDGVKMFNERMRDLLEVHDDDCVVLCSHVNREQYFRSMHSTLLKWNPETDLEITELIVPNES